MKLWVDDERPAPNNSWVIAQNYRDAVTLVRLVNFEAISLDHDLGEEKTGYDIICEIERLVAVDPSFQLPQLSCHSANPPGKARIEQAISVILARQP